MDKPTIIIYRRVFDACPLPWPARCIQRERLAQPVTGTRIWAEGWTSTVAPRLPPDLGHVSPQMIVGHHPQNRSRKMLICAGKRLFAGSSVTLALNFFVKSKLGFGDFDGDGLALLDSTRRGRANRLE